MHIRKATQGEVLVLENFAVWDAASSGNFVPTFRDNLSVPSSRVNPFSSRVIDLWRWAR